MDKIQKLRARCLTILTFMSNHTKSEEPFAEFKLIVEKEFQRKNLKGLETLSKDIDGWALGLPIDKQLELNRILEESVGQDIKGDKKTLSTIKRILNQEKIKNDKEYELILQLTKDLNEQDELFSYLGKFEKILSKYK